MGWILLSVVVAAIVVPFGITLWVEALDDLGERWAKTKSCVWWEGDALGCWPECNHLNTCVNKSNLPSGALFCCYCGGKIIMKAFEADGD